MKTQPSDLFSWLITTKLWPPPLQEEIIPRQRLLERLRRNMLTSRLTLISAPAGYGKTTLLATLQAAYPELRMAWLTLDEGDNDPTLFLAYLTAALQQLNPDYGASLRPLLADLPRSGLPIQRIVGVLINEVVRALPDPFVLVLDDLHLLNEPVIHVALDYLIERMPPQMHLIAATRYDPPLSLARLRARGQLTELRMADLRFTSEETAAFLNERLHLALPAEALKTLQTQTDGWAAGLRLLASSLDRIPLAERSAFVTHLARTDRYLFDFLATEVFQRQSIAVRTFLLETSILAELTVPLCNAVTGRDDAQAILEMLDRRSLFVMPMDEARTTFRYHALFAEFLRRKLRREHPRRWVELHRRAARAQMNEHPQRAIGHYLAAELWDEAAQAIDEVGEELLREGFLNTLVTMIETLPPSIRDTRPRLLYLLGVCAWQRGEVEEARALLSRALEAMQAIGDEASYGEVLGDLAACAILDMNLAEGETLIEQALTYPISRPTRVQLLMERAYLRSLEGNGREAEEDIREAFTITRTAPADEPSLQTMLLYMTPFSTLPPEGPERLESLYRYALAHLDPHAELPWALLNGLMAFAHFWRGQLDQTLALGETALAASAAMGGHPFLETDTAALLAATYSVLGEMEQALSCFERLFHYLETVPLDRGSATGYLYLLGRTQWYQGKGDEMHRIYRRMEESGFEYEPPFAAMLRSMMRSLLDLVEGDEEAAERRLRQAMAQSRYRPTMTLFGSPEILLAHLLLQQGREEEAMQYLTPLLHQSRAWEAPGLLLKEGRLIIPLLRLAVEQQTCTDVAQRALRLIGESHDLPLPPASPSGELLTPREMEVLHLLATGASNRAIAEELVISSETVKSHVSHILRKLDVRSRVQAVVRARDLGLLPPNVTLSPTRKT